MRAIDADACEPYFYEHLDDNAMAGALNAISEMPTIEPQRKKGTWIEQDDSWDGVYYECSACGEPWTTIDGTPWDNGMHFCPNCGAEMEDQDRNEDGNGAVAVLGEGR